MKGRFSLMAVSLACLALVGPAAAQQIGFNDGGEVDILAPMSLIPDSLPGSPVRNSGSFVRALPPAATEEPAAPVKKKSAKKAVMPAAEALEDNALAADIAASDAESIRVPMPPRRPFDLRPDGKKQKALVAKTVIEPVLPGVSTDARALTAIQRLSKDDLGLNDGKSRKDRLIQSASLPGVNDIFGDTLTERERVTPDGGGFSGIQKQIPSVQMGCLRPALIALLRKAGRRFNGPVVVTSGLRSGGRRGSYHRKCMAADIKIPGVPKNTLAAYFRTLPGAGGVGTYCQNDVVHIDVAEPRNWTYCGWRRTSFSLRGGGWGGGQHVRAGQPLPDSEGE